MSESTSTTIDAATHYVYDAVSRRLWQGQERRGVNDNGRVERVTLVKRAPLGDKPSDDGYLVQLHYSPSSGPTWVATDGIIARWPMITAGQLRKPTAPSLEVHLAIEAERARILAAWGEEIDAIGHSDPYAESMMQLQPWFTRMVNNVEIEHQ